MEISVNGEHLGGFTRSPPRRERPQVARAGVADALPATVEEAVVTGSVSRGVADDVSDVEMLVVTRRGRTRGLLLARRGGLTDLGTWASDVPPKRVSGYREGGHRADLVVARSAESAVDAVFAGELSATADALANGVALRTSGLLARWQERLRHYPDELARAHIEEAALTWGGFAVAGLLTIIRPGERAGSSSGWSTTQRGWFASSSR